MGYKRVQSQNVIHSRLVISWVVFLRTCAFGSSNTSMKMLGFLIDWTKFHFSQPWWIRIGFIGASIGLDFKVLGV